MSNYFFEVLRPGINTTFQDKGRFHMQHFGVAPGGCMDSKSFLIANALVGNSSSEGVLEFAYQGPLLKLVKGKTKISITGNVLFQINKLNTETINGECYRTYDLNEGDEIDILATKHSAYGYMALEGGFKVKSFCKSVSILGRAEIGPNEGKKIKINDKINIRINSKNKKDFLTKVPKKNKSTIRVLKGPQFDYFANDTYIQCRTGEHVRLSLWCIMTMFHSGIIILDQNAKNGEKAINYLNFNKDVIFDISLTLCKKLRSISFPL